jgi:hypothetical protein
VSAVFAFRVTEGGAGKRGQGPRGRGLGLGCSAGARGAKRGGLDLGDISLEGCLTISSEERETWTAASLRGFWATKDPEETS